jgi:general secretion pathway protein K
MRGRSEEGIALIAVLGTLALLSFIAALLSFETRTETRIARNVVDNAAARAAADAGIERAVLDLIAAPGTDNDKFRADGTIYYWRLSNITVRISVQDEIGKINLNQVSEAVMDAVLRSVGVDPGTAQSLANATADFRDPDSFSRAPGAEEADYRAAGLAWGPKNAPFEALEELQNVLGMTAEIYERVTPNLTIYSGGAINPTLAGERLTSILREAGFKDFVSDQGMAYSIRAEAKSSNGAVFVREAVVQLNPESTIPVLVLAWLDGVPRGSHDTPTGR